VMEEIRMHTLNETYVPSIKVHLLTRGLIYQYVCFSLTCVML